VAVGMADKAAPERVAEAVAHVLGEARGGGADERTPALLGPTRAQLEALRDGGLGGLPWLVGAELWQIC